MRDFGCEGQYLVLVCCLIDVNETDDADHLASNQLLLKHHYWVVVGFPFSTIKRIDWVPGKIPT